MSVRECIGMSTNNEPTNYLPLEAGRWLEQILARFEAAWRGGTPPVIQEYLPAETAKRRAALIELVHIDLEYRLKAGEGSRVETYLRSFPELDGEPRALLGLIEAECALRAPREPRLALQEYLGRFPHFRAELPARLQARLPVSANPERQAGSEERRPPLASVAELVRTLNDVALLRPNQKHELGPLASQYADARALGRELVRRAWLTPFQANQVFVGRGRELVLGPYLLLERLGEGGMGQVFKARHQLMDRIVALKVIRKECLKSEEAVRRFVREIRAAGQLSDPNIVIAHDAAQVGGTHILVTEYVEGTDLKKMMEQRGALPPAEACDYARQVARGLQHAHERGLVHRDIKPANLLVTAATRQLKILDMGLARLRHLEANDLTAGDVTQEGSVLGTPDYMAPEQAKESHTVDIRADLYSLGCTLHHLLAGKPPFAGGSLAQKIWKHQTDPPPKLEELRVDLPAGLGAVVRKLMAKRPQDRYQSPADAAAALMPFCRLAAPAAIPVGSAPLALSPGVARANAGATLAFPAAIPLTPRTAARGQSSPASPGDETLTPGMAESVSLVPSPDPPSAARRQRTPMTGQRRWLALAGGLLLCLVAWQLVSRLLSPPSRDTDQDEFIADPTKPFLRLGAGGRRDAFRTLAAALAGMRKGDVLEVHRNGPFKIDKVELRDTTLTLRAASGYRPELIANDGEAGEDRSPWFSLENTAVTIEGCDFRCPPDRTGFRGGGAPWSFRNCRLLGPPNSDRMTYNPGPRLLDYSGPRLFVADCLVCQVEGTAFHVGPKARLDLRNNVINVAAFRCIDLGAPGGQSLSLENNTVSGNGTSLLAFPSISEKEAESVTVTAARNLFHCFVEPLVRFSVEDTGPKSVRDRLRWRGTKNLYSGVDWEFVNHPKVVGFEAWQKMWGSEEIGSRGAYVGYFEWASVQNTDVVLKSLKRETEALQKRHGPKLGKVGPDWNQPGPGEGYINALLAAGKPVRPELRRPLPGKGGPFVILRGGMPVRGHARLQEALDAAGDGDIVEIRTDEAEPAGKIRSPGGSQRLVTLRGAAGYRPVLKGRLTVEHGNDLAMENIHFLEGGIVAPTDKEGQGVRIRRLANCLWDGEFYTARISAVCHRADGRPAEIVNCVINCRGYPLRLRLKVSPGRKLILRNCVVDGPLTLETLPGAGASELEVEHCYFWSPCWVCLWLQMGKANCQVRASLFEAGAPLLATWSGDMGGWRGSHNVYRVGHHSWIIPQPGPCAGLAAWSKLWQSPEDGSVEADPIIYDPLQWRVFPDSPAYRAGPGKKDLGADVSRVARTAPAKKSR
jgi:serine/threonine-protein kinase